MPEKGFYYHYKHDPLKGIFDKAYEVMGIGHHTEIDGLEESQMVMYRPIHQEAPVYKMGKHWDLRPLNMFMEEIVLDGVTLPRFRKITDPELISKLEAERNRLYLL